MCMLIHSLFACCTLIKHTMCSAEHADGMDRWKHSRPVCSMAMRMETTHRPAFSSFSSMAAAWIEAVVFISRTNVQRDPPHVLHAYMWGSLRLAQINPFMFQFWCKELLYHNFSAPNNTAKEKVTTATKHGGPTHPIWRSVVYSTWSLSTCSREETLTCKYVAGGDMLYECAWREGVKFQPLSQC